jgi:Pyruvate/2-oxoacid:ferredoxin oxidoreductase gamma subunit
MTDDVPNGDSGAISPSGRFARMEASLERIETKLDAKADNVEMQDLDKRLTTLEITDLTRTATMVAQKEAADSRYRSMLFIVAFLTIINVGLGIVVALSSILPRIVPAIT